MSAAKIKEDKMPKHRKTAPYCLSLECQMNHLHATDLLKAIFKMKMVTLVTKYKYFDFNFHLCTYYYPQWCIIQL